MFFKSLCLFLSIFVFRFIMDAANQPFLSSNHPIDGNFVEKVVVESHSPNASYSALASGIEKGLQVDLSLSVVGVMAAKGFVKHVDEALVVAESLLLRCVCVAIGESLVDTAKFGPLFGEIIRGVERFFPERRVNLVVRFWSVHDAVVLNFQCKTTPLLCQKRAE